MNEEKASQTMGTASNQQRRPDSDIEQYNNQKDWLRKAVNWLIAGLNEELNTEDIPKEEQRANVWANHRASISVERLIARIDRYTSPKSFAGSNDEAGVSAAQAISMFVDTCELVDAVMYACNLNPRVERSHRSRLGRRGGVHRTETARARMELWQSLFDPAAIKIGHEQDTLSAPKAIKALRDQGLFNSNVTFPDDDRLQDRFLELRDAGLIPPKRPRPQKVRKKRLQK